MHPYQVMQVERLNQVGLGLDCFHLKQQKHYLGVELQLPDSLVIDLTVG